MRPGLAYSGRMTPAGHEDDAPSQGGGFDIDASQLRNRSLTEEESAQVRAAVAWLLHDIRVTGAITPDIRMDAHEDLGPDVVSAWVQNHGGTNGMGIRVRLSSPPAEQSAEVAEQLQEWEIEELASAGRPATWPECPEHPNSHPLSPEVRDGKALWCCPRTGRPAWPVGGLRSS